MALSVLEKNASLARYYAARGSVEQTEFYAHHAGVFLHPQRKEELLQEAYSRGLEWTYEETRRQVLDGEFKQALYFFDAACRYGKRVGIKLGFIDLRWLDSLVWKSDASLSKKLTFRVLLFSRLPRMLL